MNLNLRSCPLLSLVLLISIAHAWDDHGLQRHGRNIIGHDRANDVATSMVVDSVGNIYTTGYSKGKGSGYDFLTLKYDPEGNEVWAERLDGGSSGDDKPIAVKVDSKGNVYVTGSSKGGPTDSDYLTVKYDSAGKLLWRQRYNGTGNGFDSPAAMAVDGAGNVFVTGYSLSKGSGYDCVTVSYAPDGKQKWASVYNGTDNEDDYGSAISLNAAGDCFVAGYSKSKADGASYLTIKYSPSGKGVWVRNFAIGVTQIARATSLVSDSNGGVCVTGFAQGTHPSYDYVTIRYDAAGKAIWSRRFDGVGHGDDKPSAIDIDTTGSYTVTGESLGTAGSGNDFLTLRYSPDGTVVWQARYDGSGLTDSASSMALDSAGGVAVTGRSVGQDSGSDFLTVKYDQNGKQSWVAKFNGDQNDLDRPVAVAVDSHRNIVVAGYSWGGKDSGFDFVTIKYGPDGKELWVRRYNGPGSLQ